MRLILLFFVSTAYGDDSSSVGFELQPKKRGASVLSPIPIPASGFGDGVVLLEPSSKVSLHKAQRLDIYGELLCPDYRAFKKVEAAIIDKYAGSNLMVVLHLFPLPYHHASYVINQCALGLAHSPADNSSPAEILIKFRNAMFEKQEDFGNSELANQTMDDIMEHIGDVAASAGLSKNDAIAFMISRDWDAKLRTMLKAAWIKGITGTPTLYLNGAPLYYVAGEDEEDDAGWTLDLLSGVIDPSILWPTELEVASSLGSSLEGLSAGFVAHEKDVVTQALYGGYPIDAPTTNLRMAADLGFY
jgi:protein-disulfide isomerase